MKLIIASNNANKVKEIKAILGDYYDEIQSLEDAGIEIDVEEDADTFEGNAMKKAAEVFDIAEADAVLSDDSGLMVDALGGAPGVHSARFATDGHDNEANKKKLIEVMKDVPWGNRTCRFASAVALVRKNGKPLTAVGVVEGRLLNEERGHNGFGYDPLFFYEPLQRSFAELSPEEKNSISHRKRALTALREMLMDRE